MNQHVPAKPFYQDHDLGACILLLLCFAVGILVVGTDGNFPLNDDWSYARGVYSYVEEGTLELDQWPAMTLIAQIWIGIGYSEVFGFSFETLRWSTLVNAYIGLCFFYLLLRRFTYSRMAFFAALLLLYNPLFYSLSFTFMTEVHFLMAVLGSMYFFTRYVEDSRYTHLLWASLFSVLATLIRQPGVLVPLAFALVLMIRERTWVRRLVPLLPFLLSFTVLKLYYAWLGNQFPDLYKVGGFSELITALTTQGADSLLRSFENMLLLPGWWLFPLLVLLLPTVQWRKASRNVFLWVFSAVALVFTIACLDFFPVGNVFYNLGLGPKLLKGVMWGHENVEPRFGGYLWNCFKYVAVAGMVATAILLWQNSSLQVSALFASRKMDRRVLAKWGIALFCCGYFVITVSIASIFDRYTLHLVPALAILMIPIHSGQKVVASTLSTVLALACLALTAIFSVAATHDYLSWNRARSEAYAFLTVEQGIPPTRIDAGFEINGWQKAGPDGYQSGSDKSWWFVTEDDFVIAFFPLENFTEVRAYPWKRLLPPGSDSLLVLEKIPEATLDHLDFPIYSDLEDLAPDGTSFTTNDSDVNFGYAALQTTERYRSGRHAIKLDSINAFGLTSKYKGFRPGDTIVVNVWRTPLGNTAGIVIDSEGTDSFYELSNTNIVETDGNWERLETRFTIPQNARREETAIYIWNPEGSEVWLDDFVIDLRRPSPD